MAPTARGPVVWLSGSCSDATRRQVEAARAAVRSFRIDPLAIAGNPGVVDTIAAQAVAALSEGPTLVYATAPPDEVAAAQAALGTGRAAGMVEASFRTVATTLAANGVRAFVVAGGETAGAVVDALGVRALAIGPEIDPGVPWTRAVGGEAFWLALKSGNFGGPDFFAKATEALQ
jgi:uncharacterized protein YgbK (DUF1537 family)